MENLIPKHIVIRKKESDLRKKQLRRCEYPGCGKWFSTVHKQQFYCGSKTKKQGCSYKAMVEWRSNNRDRARKIANRWYFNHKEERRESRLKYISTDTYKIRRSTYEQKRRTDPKRQKYMKKYLFKYRESHKS